MTADRSSRRGRFATAALLLPLCVALFAPGLTSLPPVDRDEPRFAQASRQMWQSGDYVDIRFQDESRHWKPIGIYWLQSAVLAAVGEHGAAEIWPYRVPSLVGATLAVIFTAWIGADLFGRWTGRLAALMLATSLLLGVEARLATTDAALLAATIAAQGALAHIYLSRTHRDAATRLLWIASAVAILLKGPVVLAVGGGTILFLVLFDRERIWLKRLRPVFGLLVVLAIAGPWLIAIALETGGAFQRTIVTDWMTRLVAAKESHGGPPGYHVASFLIAFWPFSILSVLAVRKIWSVRNEKPVRFCLAWILPFWILCELMGTKLPHYVLPTYPAIALLTAYAASSSTRRNPLTRFQRFAVGTWLGLGLSFGIVVFVLPIVADQRFDPFALLFSLVVFSACGGVAILLRQGRGTPAIACLGVAAVLLSGLGFGKILPRLDSIWLSRRVAASVAALDGCENRVVASSDFHEPSLVFLLGEATRLVGPQGAAEHLLGDPACALALVSEAQEEGFFAAFRAVGTTPVAVDQFEGINYAKGRRVKLTLFALETALDEHGEERTASLPHHGAGLVAPFAGEGTRN